MQPQQEDGKIILGERLLGLGLGETEDKAGIGGLTDIGVGLTDDIASHGEHDTLNIRQAKSQFGLRNR